MLDDETASLGDAIQEIVGGIVTGFVCFAEFMNPETGIADRGIFTPMSQPTWRSMGMAGYLGEWYRDDCKAEMYQRPHDAEGEE